MKIDEELKNFENIQKNEMSFTNELLKEVEKEIENETAKIKNFDKEKEVIKNGVMSKIFYFVFGKLIKRLTFGCYVKVDGHIIWSYEFPKN